MGNNKKNKISKILAWIGLIFIAIFIIMIIYALLTQNGRLALAFIVGLMMLSVIVWAMIYVYKKIEEKYASKNDDENILDATNIKTKSL